jgi:hypothetical protein
MKQSLKPTPGRRIRLLILVPLWILAAIGTTSWLEKLGFIAGTALMFGSYRRFEFTSKTLLQRWTIGFINLPPQKWKLRRFTRLQVEYDQPTGISEFLLFGPSAFLYGWLLDRFFPWIGGCYRIWLNDEVDERVLAWQWNSQSSFEANVDLLQSVTGLSVTCR